ncbi:PBS lyase [Chlorella sorokiniana]|uniref:PBS lyase n=1 Tax=Chlorella sorokiniana TaxID=3076 RepID=A0A2P6TQH6_CHLSO|nr:PBS lyase [Chlorella sorokiniana]|eukprot:PRW56289.1 PBS lyase [Chlorella sorokiniana]
MAEAQLAARLQAVRSNLALLAVPGTVCTETPADVAISAHALLKDFLAWEASLQADVRFLELISAVRSTVRTSHVALRVLQPRLTPQLPLTLQQTDSFLLLAATTASLQRIFLPALTNTLQMVVRCPARAFFAASANSPAFQLADGMHQLQLLNALGNCMTVTRDILLASNGLDHTASLRQLQAMSAAHWEAVTACIARLSPEAAPRLVERAGSLLPSLALVLGRGPLALALSPSVHELFSKLWHQPPQSALCRSRQILDMLLEIETAPCLSMFLIAEGTWRAC